MNEQIIKQILSPHPWGALVRCVEACPSTNALVKQLALQGAPEGTACIAERQTAGRGRLGRSFFSPEGGIYLSVLLRPGKTAPALFDLTARVAVCVRRAISDTCGCDVGIKWVNDLILHGKKIGGILTELVGGAEPSAIVGIGINCGGADFPPELCEIASSLFAETGRLVDREALAASILRNLSDILFEIDWLPEYRACCVTLGKNVRLLSPQGEREAFAMDVTETAALLVRLPDGTVEEVSSGEASLHNNYE